ncbi:hypothetical protein DID88_009384 [Monilinia fructigena]|uniref:Major facilitator superfamily (MFS) profile domain-containing protein n=1 Tax=Monilinia fructigena TaxID=38457 RepID=A0A395IME1_9HELO|nr:hypothetical protein DID88_009384 [Monilinia fructigena]
MASSPLSNSPGVLADIWGPVERGNAMALFSMMTFAGPALGPVISGFLELKRTGGGTSMIRALKIPGFEDVKTPVEASNRTLSQIFKIALTRPWQILIDPISFAVAIYLSVVYALLYMLFTIYPIIFQEKRGWNSGVGELPLIGTIVGAIIGGIAIFIVSVRDRKKLEAGHVGVAEDRLPVAMVGGLIFPITMFWFAWSGNYNSVHWIVPTIGGVFLATSILLIFVAYLNYLTDTYLMYAASAVAANTVCRSAAGAAAPLFTTYMFDALGVGGGGSLIGGIAFLLAPIPFLFYKYVNEKGIEKTQPSPDQTTEIRSSESSSSPSSIASMPDAPREDTYHQEGYIEEGMGYNRVALPSDTRVHDAGQLASEK